MEGDRKAKQKAEGRMQKGENTSSGSSNQGEGKEGSRVSGRCETSHQKARGLPRLDGKAPSRFWLVSRPKQEI